MQYKKSEKLELKKSTADFKEVGRQFISVFKRKHRFKKETEGLVKKGVENVPENVTENVPENRLRAIFDLIKNNKKITVFMMAKKLSVNEKTIKRDIIKLKQKSILKRVGPDKGGYWDIISS